MKRVRVIVAGGREFNDYNFLMRSLDKVLICLPKCDIEIVEGECRGTDLMAKRYAEENGLQVKPFPADWTKGKKAGYIRNHEMAVYSTHLVAFWDGKSAGTKMMIDLANDVGLRVRVIRY